MLYTLTGAYSVHLKWSEPRQPNGLISHYRLVYKKHQEDPTLNSTAVTALTVEVNAHIHSKWWKMKTCMSLSLRVVSSLITHCFLQVFVVSDILLVGCLCIDKIAHTAKIATSK